MKTLTQKEIVGDVLQRFPTPTKTIGSIYVHVPFCAKKCPYCHFFVQPLQDVDLYLDGIRREWDFRKFSLDDALSLYIGGGTPSLLSLKELETLLSLFPFNCKETTIEANPDDITEEKLRGYLSLGINRLSIGVQSLDDSDLGFIQRNHSAKKALDAILLAHTLGFDNISIDLMYDLPHQTFAKWKRTVDRATTLPITHLSIYNLVFEEGTSFFKRKKDLEQVIPQENESVSMLEYAASASEKAGLHRYEISAFARPNKESVHNTGYWIGRPFVGLGPSAFSYLKGRRFRNIAHLKKWHKALLEGKDPLDFEETLPYPENVCELLAIRLRLLEGVDIRIFPTLPETTLSTLNKLVIDKLLIQTGSHFRLSERGKLFYDLVASELI